ncbi:MAG: Holliday junction resolvase RuvX [Flavobacteriaceae bacterium]
MGCIVGIDFGVNRTGLASTDPNQIIATGLDNLPTADVIPFLKAFCQKEEVDSFIIGKPLQKDGSPSSVEPQIQAFLKRLQIHFPNQTIERYDERYTSKIAFQSMIDGGLTKKKRSVKGTVDEVSAVIILQSYLEYKTNTL